MNNPSPDSVCMHPRFHATPFFCGIVSVLHWIFRGLRRSACFHPAQLPQAHTRLRRLTSECRTCEIPGKARVVSSLQPKRRLGYTRACRSSRLLPSISGLLVQNCMLIYLQILSGPEGETVTAQCTLSSCVNIVSE